QIVAELGEKPIWLTEAYAPTFPNSWWHDTYRHAAENVVLTMALAVAEGIRGVHWYQLHNSTWYDVGGVSETDPEYHYGLLHRDGSLKASLLAYCTVAEALDQAEFARWLDLPAPDAKGLLFDRPDGQVAILWSRADGYILNGKKEGYAELEPWIDPWPTKTTINIPAEGPVRVIDCIGRETVVTPAGGEVALVLDGAPRIVYGLAFD
ncbi:MAG TPA: hypothetical protein QGH10_18665, partial [Armatimonadota bacterium]|nr:hypothetical protein [Armatimonadota bacterium]